MNTQDNTTGTVREAVALFAEREDLQGAIDTLLKTGFEKSDLSLLSSHESIAAAEEPENRLEDLRTALGDELKYLGPLTAAGFIMLATEPLAVLLAGVVAAGIGGIALKEVLDEVMSTPHAENFARALAAGSVILWVRVPDAGREAVAVDILRRQGGGNVHVDERPAGT